MPYPQISEAAILTFGGYSFVKPSAWEDYMHTMLENRHPAYVQHHGQAEITPRWKDNACILESLSEYLFHQFGMTVPLDNLFKVYNMDGEGIEPASLIEAIEAIIEPLGYAVDKIIAPDAELRQGLGRPDIVVDISRSGEFDDLPGVAMINIRDGYSHAFYWPKMQAAKFTKEQFRMAILIRPLTPPVGESLSSRDSLENFCWYIRENFSSVLEAPGSKSTGLSCKLLEEMERLTACLELLNPIDSNSILVEIVHKLDAIDEMILIELSDLLPEDNPTYRVALEASRMVKRIFQDAQN
jgi:hypothetical protein